MNVSPHVGTVVVDMVQGEECRVTLAAAHTAVTTVVGINKRSSFVSNLARGKVVFVHARLATGGCVQWPFAAVNTNTFCFFGVASVLASYSGFNFLVFGEYSHGVI